MRFDTRPRRSSAPATSPAAPVACSSRALRVDRRSPVRSDLTGAGRARSVSLDDVKAIRIAFGGTVNDVVLAAVTRGFRELLRGAR